MQTFENKNHQNNNREIKNLLSNTSNNIMIDENKKEHRKILYGLSDFIDEFTR